MNKLIIPYFLALSILFASILNAAEITKDAKRHMFRGQAAMEEAKDVTDYHDAITEFKKSIEYAPDWADAWFNLGVAQESAEDYTGAMESFNKYLTLKPTAADSSEIEGRIFKLEYKKEKQTKSDEDAKRTAQEEQDKQIEEALAQKKRDLEETRKLVGTWYVQDSWFGPGLTAKVNVTNEMGSPYMTIDFSRWIRKEWGLAEYYYFSGVVVDNKFDGQIEFVHVIEGSKYCPKLTTYVKSRGEIQNNGKRIYLEFESIPLAKAEVDCGFQERTDFSWGNITFNQ